MTVTIKKILSRWCLCLCGILSCTSGIGQHWKRDSTKRGYLQIICQTGLFGTGINTDSISLPGSIYNAVDIRYGWRSARNGLYRSIYRHPTFGLGFYAATFARPEIGSPNALYGFVDFPFWNKNQHWEWVYSLALGLSYNFSPYDPEKNPLNTLIGSRQNAYIHFHNRANYHVNQRLSFGMGIGFTHFSNGAYRLPNVGLNKVSMLMGVQYRMSHDPLRKQEISLPVYDRKHQTEIFWSNGLKNLRPGGAVYWKSGVGVNHTWSIDHRYRLGLGADVFFRSGSGDPSGSGNQADNPWNAGLSLAWTWMITERLYLPINIGTYLNRYTEAGAQSRIYERIGIRYMINKNIFAGVTIKAHMQVADYTEWTIGYRPRSK